MGGHRLMEALRLRVKDMATERREVNMRNMLGPGARLGCATLWI